MLKSKWNGFFIVILVSFLQRKKIWRIKRITFHIFNVNELILLNNKKKKKKKSRLWRVIFMNRNEEKKRKYIYFKSTPNTSSSVDFFHFIFSVDLCFQQNFPFILWFILKLVNSLFHIFFLKKIWALEHTFALKTL